MNPTPTLSRLAAALLVAGGLSSCVVYDDSYYGGGGYTGGGGYAYSDDYYDDEWGDTYYGYHPAIFPAFVTYSVSSPYFYGGRYYSYRWWNDGRYRSYCYDHGGNRHRHTSRRSSNEIRMVRNTQGGRTPQGFHSREWYKDRGYNLRTNTYVDRSGETSGRQTNRTRSSSSSSNVQRSSSVRRDDDHNTGGRSNRAAVPSRSSKAGDRDTRIASAHPRALQQPDKYRYTGGGRRAEDNRRSSQGDRPSSEGNRRSSEGNSRSSGGNSRSGDSNRGSGGGGGHKSGNNDRGSGDNGKDNKR